jgi:uncharacterized protein
MPNCQFAATYFCLAGLLALSGATAATASEAKIVVHGSGLVQVEPDLAMLRIGVNTREADPGAAQARNTTEMKALVAALEEAGIKREDMSTSSFAFQRLSDRSLDDKATEEDYRVSNDLNVLVRNIDRLGNIIAVSVKAGGNDIGQIDFLSSDPVKFVDQARQKAFADAKSEAELSAVAAGMRLGTIVSIYGGRATVPQSYGMMEAADAPRSKQS